MAITVEIYKQIRKRRLDGMSQRQIAAVLRISRNTVKKYWDGDSVPRERKDYSREASVLTEDVVAFVRQCLDEDTGNPSKDATDSLLGTGLVDNVIIYQRSQLCGTEKSSQ